MHRLPLNLPELPIGSIETVSNGVIITAHSTVWTANCPQCSVVSRSIHSYYWRRVDDLPVSGQLTQLKVAVKRFRCRNKECPRGIFVERLACLPFYAQRTARLAQALQAIAFGLGGEAGARLATQLHMLVSPDTLLRLMGKWSAPQPPNPKQVGVDDWALRKRVTYGTIIVDLETRQPIDLLEDRTAAVLKAWLLEHQQVEVIARDPSGEYASGSAEGAPQAIQVADRFLLLENLKQMLDRLLTTMYGQIRPLLIVKENNDQQVLMPTRLLASIRDSSAHEQATSAASRERRLETYQPIKQLKSAGWKIGQISRRLDINATTVRKYFYAETFPQRASRSARGSILDAYLKHLESRYREGCQNALQLWREIREKGYLGTRRQVSKWMSKRGEQDQAVVCSTEGPTIANSGSSPAPRPLSNALPSARQLAWLMMRQCEQLNEQENKVLARIQENTQVKQVHALAQEFIGMVKKRDVAQLDPWLQNCKASGIAMLQSFATRIKQDYAAVKQDYAAVRAALETAWSNGQTEGQVNRLKLLKRQMYGRANFDLLRQRVLYPT